MERGDRENSGTREHSAESAVLRASAWVGTPARVCSDVANHHSSTTDPTCSQLASPAALYSGHRPKTFGGPQNRGEVPPGPLKMPVNNLLLPFAEKSTETWRRDRAREEEAEPTRLGNESGQRATALSFHCSTGIFIYFLENAANLIVRCL